jgi:hypothetical protein
VPSLKAAGKGSNALKSTAASAHLRGTAKREQVGEFTILTPNLRQASIASGRD